MQVKKKFRTTSFWLGLSGAVVIILNTLSSIFKLDLYSKEAEAIILAIGSALVLLGVVNKKDVKDEKERETKDLLDDLNNHKDE